MRERRPPAFWCLAAFFGLFVLFLYGPMLTIIVLSFQGPSGGLTFPMHGVSTHWFSRLWGGLGVVDIWAAFQRSLKLGVTVMILTVLISLPAGYAFRRGFRGANAVFYTAVASLIVPSIIVSLGIGVEFRLFDEAIKWLGEAFGIAGIAERFTTVAGTFTSGLGRPPDVDPALRPAHHVRGVQPLRPPLRGGRARSGATPWQTFRHVVLPIIAPSLVGIGLFGFTLSWDEAARSSQAFGSDQNTLPLELTGLTTTVTNPEIYALGTVTTGVSLAVILVSLLMIHGLQRRPARGPGVGEAAP